MFKWLTAAATTTVVLPLSLVLLLAADPGPTIAEAGAAGGPSVLAISDIPPVYLTLYMGAAQTCPGLSWGVLAGIGKVESNHGRSTDPGVHSGANFAGAEGPMQFEPATFARYATDGDHDGQLSPYDPGDAIYTAAALLCANGAASGTQAGIRQAVFAYNHSWSYVNEVLSWAARYTVPAPVGAAATAIGFALPRSASPTGGAQPVRAPTTAPVWSSPPTPLRASASPGARSAGGRTAPGSRSPRSSPVTCCSPPGPTAPTPTPATS